MKTREGRLTVIPAHCLPSFPRTRESTARETKMDSRFRGNDARSRATFMVVMIKKPAAIAMGGLHIAMKGLRDEP